MEPRPSPWRDLALLSPAVSLSHSLPGAPFLLMQLRGH